MKKHRASGVGIAGTELDPKSNRRGLQARLLGGVDDDSDDNSMTFMLHD
jgi:hypothetical protein